MTRRLVLTLTAVATALSGCSSPMADLPVAVPRADTPAGMIVAGAKAQIGTLYTPGYFAIDYPGGDLPLEKGSVPTS